MPDDRVEFKNNGMARCGLCGDPSVVVLVGDPREIEQNPYITVRCHGCAMTEAAEAITKAAADA